MQAHHRETGRLEGFSLHPHGMLFPCQPELLIHLCLHNSMPKLIKKLVQLRKKQAVRQPLWEIRQIKLVPLEPISTETLIQ